jgi:hypothetical protein
MDALFPELLVAGFNTELLTIVPIPIAWLIELNFVLLFHRAIRVHAQLADSKFGCARIVIRLFVLLWNLDYIFSLGLGSVIIVCGLVLFALVSTRAVSGF